MRHFVVISEWFHSNDIDFGIIAIRHTLDEAKEAFRQYVDGVKCTDVSEFHMKIGCDTDIKFSARSSLGIEYPYGVKIYIQEVIR